jgi:hypothetical protein
MPQDPNQGYGNTPQPQQPPGGSPPPYSGQPPQNPYGPPTGYGTGPQNPYGAPQNPYEAPPGYGVPPQGYGTPSQGYGAPPPGYGVPPQGYGAPPQGFEPAFSGPAGSQTPLTPLPLNEAVRQLPNQYIRVLTKPSAATFSEELRKSSWDITLVQLLIMIVVGIVFGLITALLSSAVVNAYVANGDLTGTSLQAVRAILVSSSIGGAFLRILTVPVGFFIGVGVQFLLAKAFSGQGTFLTQSYTTLLYQVPIYVISSLLSLLGVIPAAGGFIIGLVGLVLGIYSIVLNVYQIMATHRLSGGKATAVVLIPYGILLLLVLLCAIAFGALLLGTMRNIPR